MTTEASVTRSRKKTILTAAFAVSVYLTVSITLASFPAETIIDAVGSGNAFLLMFFLGIVGGLTTFTGIPYHLVLMSLAAGGLSPIGLGLCTAIGVMLGDSTMYLVGAKVKHSLPSRLLATMNHLADYLLRHPKFVPPVLMAYGAVSPFSNDFIVVSLSVVGYSFWRTIIPLTIGNIFYNIALAYLGLYAYEAVIDWF